MYEYVVTSYVIPSFVSPQMLYNHILMHNVAIGSRFEQPLIMNTEQT